MQSDINMLRQNCLICALYNQLPGEYVEIYTGMQKFNSTQIFIHVSRPIIILLTDWANFVEKDGNVT